MRGFGPDAVSVSGPPGFNYLIFCYGIQLFVLLSPYLCFVTFLYLDSYVLGDDSWISQGSFMQNQTYMWLDPHQHEG